MKVEYVKIAQLESGWAWVWIWSCDQAASTHFYSRRRDAVRGFKRFQARVRAM